MAQQIHQYTMNIGQRKVKVEWDERMDINFLFCAVFNCNKKITYFYFEHIDEGAGNDNNDDDYVGSINDDLELSIYGSNTRRIQILGSSTFVIYCGQNEALYKLRAENLWERPETYIYQEIEVHQRIKVEDGEPQNQLVFELNDKPNEDLYIQHIFKSYEENGKRIHKQYMKLIKTSEKEIPLGLSDISRCKFTCIFHKVKKVSDMKYFVTNSYRKEFNSHNSINDVYCLYEEAKGFIEGSGKIPVRYLYRNKPSDHPTIQDMEETGVMKKYIKDNSGDPCSSINLAIDGLFFGASPDRFTGNPPKRSPFGDFRIMIEPQYLLHGLNLYFADFFCMTKSPSHNVTIVLTKPGSREDSYCRNRLIPLDIKENEFFWYSHDDDQYYTTAHRELWVELFYTEDIMFDRMRSERKLKIVTDCPPYGSGQSKPEGLPKKTYCKICNLHRIPT